MTQYMQLGCNCPACMVARANMDTEQQTPSADYTGTNADALSSGYKWANNRNGLNLTYKFHQGYQSYWVLDTSTSYSNNGMTAFTAAQKTAVTQILGMLSSFTKLTFTEVAGATDPQIGFINANASQTNLAGSAYYPTGWQGAGDVFINKNFWGFNQVVTQGSTNFFVLMHEIGHTLGLEHSFDHLSGEQASEKYSVMAYDMTTWGSVNAGTYMLYDMAALQDMYGVNMNYNATDTVYMVSATAASTIWDGGGNDTLDGSGYNGGMTLNLNDGTYSSIGLTDNLAIAYNATIENAIGGNGNDIVYGNTADNIISLGAGDDIVYGSAGNDTIDGGSGNDTLSYSAAFNTFLFNMIGGTLQIVNNLLGSDLVTSIENFLFSGFSKTWNDLIAASTSNSQFIDEAHGSVAGSRRFNFTNTEEGQFIYSAKQMRFKGVKGSLLEVDRTGDHLEISSLKPKKLFTIAFAHDGDLNVSIHGFKTADLNVQSVNGVEIHATGIARGAIVTGDGNDIINLNLIPYGDKKVRGLGIRSGAGDDEIVVFGAHKRSAISIDAGDGHDHITINGAGVHTIHGGNGDDIIHGGQTGNYLYGDAGNDFIYGAYSGDYIDGGTGSDTLTGGAGADIFVLSADASDTVTDFIMGQDKIDISQIIEPGLNPSQSAINNFVAITYNGSEFTLSVDANGGGDNFVQVATVQGTFSPDITAQDLINQHSLLI